MKCPKCKEDLTEEVIYQSYGKCPFCDIVVADKVHRKYED